MSRRHWGVPIAYGRFKHFLCPGSLGEVPKRVRLTLPGLSETQKGHFWAFWTFTGDYFLEGFFFKKKVREDWISSCIPVPAIFLLFSVILVSLSFSFLFVFSFLCLGPLGEVPKRVRGSPGFKKVTFEHSVRLQVITFWKVFFSWKRRSVRIE